MDFKDLKPIDNTQISSEKKYFNVKNVVITLLVSTALIIGLYWYRDMIFESFKSINLNPVPSPSSGSKGKIIFTNVDNGINIYYSFKPDIKELVEFKLNYLQDVRPVFSFNGKQIVYVSEKRIYVKNTDGSSEAELIFYDENMAVKHPSFSPSGDKIVFSGKMINIDIFHEKIYTVDFVSGSMNKNLTEVFIHLDESPIIFLLDYPVFTADGNQIICKMTYKNNDPGGYLSFEIFDAIKKNHKTFTL